MKSTHMKAAASLSEFFVSFRKKALARNITDEQFEELIADDKMQWIWIDAAVTKINSIKGVIISFFENTTSIKLSLGDDFKNRILSEKPQSFPKPPKSIKRELAEFTTNQKVFSEYEIQPYTVPELLSVIFDKITEQPEGEKGELETDGLGNLFFVQLGRNCVVPVCILWNGMWSIGSGEIGDAEYIRNHYVFFHA